MSQNEPEDAAIKPEPPGNPLSVYIARARAGQAISRLQSTSNSDSRQPPPPSSQELPRRVLSSGTAASDGTVEAEVASTARRDPPSAANAPQVRVHKRRKAKKAKRLTENLERQRVRPETRTQMLERLTNPLISLHEASVLLRVCPATVRRFSDEDLLVHVRTAGGQRRFYLRDVLLLVRQLEEKGK